MTTDRKRLLARRLREAVAQQPKIKDLRRLLLRIGGVQLVAPPRFDDAVPTLLTSGFVMTGPVQQIVITSSACHQNVARLWIKQQRRVVGIGNGYALSADGLWRQHSWGVLREGIIETTEERTKYFGLLLQGDDADSFALANSN